MCCRPVRMLVLVGVACACPAAGADEPLLKYLPGEMMNSVAVVRVAEIAGDPPADRQPGTTLKLPGAENIPAWVDRIVLGSQVRLGSNDPVRMIAIAAIPQGGSIVQAADPMSGTPEQLAGRTVMVTSRGDLLVDVASQTAALVRPGVRQEVARWLTRLDADGMAPMAPYLREAADLPQQIVLAMDLHHVLSAAQVTPWLETRPGQPAGTDVSAMADLLSRLVGARVAVAVGPPNTAEFRVRFEGEITQSAEELRQLFKELLFEAHASINEIDTGEATIEGSEFVLRTPLSDGGLRRIFSLISSPPPTRAPEKQATEDEPPATPATMAQTYFNAIDELVTDLERSQNRSKNYLRTATWHENYAASIEQLPQAGVDPGLVDYGLRTASGLRALAGSLRGQTVEVTAHQQTLTFDYRVYPGQVGYNVWGWWGGSYQPTTWRATSNVQQVRERQAAAVVAGTQERQEIWKAMANDRAQTARTMTEKFGVPFGQIRR